MSVTTTQAPVVLEQASQEFVEATAQPPYLYELTPAETRKVPDDVQAAPIDSLTIDSGWREVAERALVFVERFEPATPTPRPEAVHA